MILKEHKGNEGSCIGISKYPVKDQNYRTTTDMWLYRAYKYVFKLNVITKVGY